MRSILSFTPTDRVRLNEIVAQNPEWFKKDLHSSVEAPNAYQTVAASGVRTQKETENNQH